MGSLLDDPELSGASTPKSKVSDGPSTREKINEALAGPVGKAILALVFLAVGTFAFVRVMEVLGPPTESYVGGELRTLNASTGEMSAFPMGKVPDGWYPVEYCFLKSCGPEGGTPVILNKALFDESDPRYNEATACPCCGSPVTPHNPIPGEYYGLDLGKVEPPPCAVDYYQSVAGG